MIKDVAVAACLLAFSTVAAAQPTIGWPDTVDLLVQEKSQAEACVALLKDAGFTIALVQGGKPENLPRTQANLEKAGKGLKEVCDAAIKAATAAGGTRGVVDEIVKGAVGPVVDALKSAAGALWTQHVEQDKLEMDSIKGQLEAAKWPDFGPAP